MTLLHVKASGSDAVDRRMSVSDYEIVIGQAIKNLRFLDLHLNTSEFVKNLNRNLTDAVWHAGRPAQRGEMLEEMVASGRHPRVRVVVVQPRTTRTALSKARSANNSLQSSIAKQLDTLLLAARANCRALGAELVVIADDS